ncbi:zf-TFIIB domain-containing protein [Streptomyces sp. NBC_01190]|uniref:TFIIB-type zinc ribbon-containing protein n=1 Tax=Streptomyces sp. NBC_01190 TaxID=2903767 RepID=UPI0038639088|nr:zf-TFIIB domain-containing protein [Streptomyces sp. NBC_01190]
MVCPKCHGHMQTYNRNGVQIEQCGNCRGIFLDYGELETLTQLEGRWAQPAPPPQAYPAPPVYQQPAAPVWAAPYDGGHGHGHGQHGGHHDRHGFAHMLFSS